MKRVDQILASIRERTRNLNYTTDDDGNVTSGISTSLILQFMNEAQDHLQSAIIAAFPNEFVETAVIDMVANQEEYTIPDRLFLNNKIVMVQYRSDTSPSSYCTLSQGVFRDRLSYSGYPAFYIRRGNKIMLQPSPQASRGDIRVMYYRELDDLAVRSGVISARTISSGAITALTIDTASAYTDAAAIAALETADYICVNDRYGNVTMYNIPITAYNSSTGVITIADNTFTFSDGETADVGAFIAVGRYATTQSKLPDNCERYLNIYAQKRVLTTDESNTSLEEDIELKTIEQDILTSFGDESRDIETIPVIDWDLMI